MTRYKHSEKAFTLLEMIVVMAIIATATVSLYPAFSTISTRKNFVSSVDEFSTELSNTRLSAFSKGMATRITTTKAGDVYTLSSFVATTTVTSCNSTGTWTSLNTRTVKLNSRFSISGTGIGDVCFYRDGTSSGGTFTFVQKDGGTDVGSASINIYLSTGFIDVSIK